MKFYKALKDIDNRERQERGEKYKTIKFRNATDRGGAVLHCLCRGGNNLRGNALLQPKPTSQAARQVRPFGERPKQLSPTAQLSRFLRGPINTIMESKVSGWHTGVGISWAELPKRAISNFALLGNSLLGVCLLKESTKSDITISRKLEKSQSVCVTRHALQSLPNHCKLDPNRCETKARCTNWMGKQEPWVAGQKKTHYLLGHNLKQTSRATKLQQSGAKTQLRRKIRWAF